MRIAGGLLYDITMAEDIVQEVFLMLVHSAGSIQIKSNLKGYLTTCVVNKIRNQSRARKVFNFVSLEDNGLDVFEYSLPEHRMICQEESGRIYSAMARLPYEQREAIILHIQGGMKFKEIAELQDVAVKTARSRYQYGLDKLRSIIDRGTKK